MKPNTQTIQQLERFMNKIAQKFPCDTDDEPMTDIHVRVSQETGDLMAFDDDDNEITRCVVEQWIDNKEGDFFQSVAESMRQQFKKMKSVADSLGIIKPYSFVLENDDRESVAELYVADDDTVIIGGDLMKGLDDDLDKFLDKLMKE